MSTRDANIKPLPPDVVAKIKSSTSITNLNGVVVELVKNALDANAHSINVTIDFHRGCCIVEDDGEGIPPAEFEVGGGLGKAHRMYSDSGIGATSLGSLTDSASRYLQVSV
jgi:DNA mismatch repair protein MLH3